MSERPSPPDTEYLLKLLLEQGQDYALFLMAPNETVVEWFPGAEHIFGYRADEVVGKQATFLFNAEDLERGAEKHEFAVAASSGRAEDDRWHVRKDRSLFWGSGVLFALREGETLVGYAKLIRNRTDLKTQTEALENRVKALARLNEQKDIFLGVLSHELRNPLGALVNAVELIRRAGVDTGLGAAGLHVIDRQTAALRRLVDDLMDTARIGAGKMDLELRPIDLKDVAREAAASARPLARARNQEFQEIIVRGPVPVHADALRLQQVLANLLNNAIKYTPDKGRIVLIITTEGGDAVIRVEDNGIGMTAETLPQVFELFTQAESSRKEAQGGLGLGLALVRQIVELHAGTVQARSEGQDKGSIFTVRIPLLATTQP